MGFLNLNIMSEISYYSVEGLRNLKEELLQLEQVERPRVITEIADARDKGDLSENAEYHAAKEEQSHLEFKIAKLKNVISSARIIDESQLDASKILIHSIVKIKNVANGMEFAYTLVADSETDVRNGKLSVNSPIGKGLLGKEVGDVAEIKVPNGIMKFEIVDISR
jgi:transcription elongation factor GreA